MSGIDPITLAVLAGRMEQIADEMGGPCYTLAEIKAELLYQAVLEELDR